VSDVSPIVEPVDNAPPPAEPAPQFQELQRLSIPVEAMTDSHRIIGELQLMGVVRRLVDILNSIDGGYLLFHECRVDDPFKTGDEPRHLEVIQILRDAILFIMPRSDAHPSDPFEVVRKAPVPASIVVPGFEIAGDVHLMPGADPVSIPLIGTHYFAPVTNATVRAAQGRSDVRQEPVVLVNLARALLYGPRQA